MFRNSESTGPGTSIFRSRCVQGVVLRPLPGIRLLLQGEPALHLHLGSAGSGLHDGCHSGYSVACSEGAAVGQGKNGAW